MSKLKYKTYMPPYDYYHFVIINQNFRNFISHVTSSSFLIFVQLIVTINHIVVTGTRSISEEDTLSSHNQILSP